MSLRNAFEEMATERTLRLLLAAANYARDINDRMRVVVDNTVVTTTTVTAGPYLNGVSTLGVTRAWNDPLSTFAMDQREIHRQASLQHGNISRQRWTYS